jgi:hypothetical protein
MRHVLLYDLALPSRFLRIQMICALRRSLSAPTKEERGHQLAFRAPHISSYVAELLIQNGKIVLMEVFEDSSWLNKAIGCSLRGPAPTACIAEALRIGRHGFSLSDVAWTCAPANSAGLRGS